MNSLSLRLSQRAADPFWWINVATDRDGRECQRRHDNQVGYARIYSRTPRELCPGRHPAPGTHLRRSLGGLRILH